MLFVVLLRFSIFAVPSGDAVLAVRRQVVDLGWVLLAWFISGARWPSFGLQRPLLSSQEDGCAAAGEWVCLLQPSLAAPTAGYSQANE